jgi:hypothetical protein
MICGLIFNKVLRNNGEKTYSPGLEFDAEIYKQALKNMKIDVLEIKSWYENLEERKKYENLVKKCSVVIGIEDMGVWDYTGKIIIWMPNLEINNPHVKIPKRVDYVICKTEANSEFPNLIKNLWSFEPKILYIPHTTPFKLENFGEKIRKGIVHFAGSSPFKNTLEQAYVGVYLLRYYPELFDSFILKITESPHGYKISKQNLEILEKLALLNPKFKLLKGGWMSDEAKQEIFQSSCLSLCASETEGFGHYIMESLGSGCMVVTTDGWPMNMLVHGDQIAFAKFRNSYKLNLGIGYNVPAINIIRILESSLIPCLVNKKYKPENSILLYKKQNELFNKEFKAEFSKIV